MTRVELNALRGMACLLLVFNHVVGGTPQEGLRLESGLLRDGVDALSAIRMPLFACIAGITHFHVRQSGLALMRDKAHRLLLPMLLTGTVFAVVQAAAKGQDRVAVNWLTLHLLPVAHYWFLESLFIVIGVWSLARSQGAKVLFTAAAVWAYLLGLGTPWLGIAGAVYLAPFFALGWWWSWVKPNPYPPRSQLLAWLALAAAVALVVLTDAPAANRMAPTMLVASALACAAMLTLRPNLAGLRWVGELSYVVFLFHVFFTAPARGLLQTLGIADPAVHLVLGSAAAVAGSALVRWAVTRLGGPALWFIGGKPKAKILATPAPSASAAPATLPPETPNREQSLGTAR